MQRGRGATAPVGCLGEAARRCYPDNHLQIKKISLDKKNFDVYNGDTSERRDDMKPTEVMRKLMEEQGIGNAKLANRLGVTPAVAWDRVNNEKKKNGMSVKMLVDMLAVMDYKVVVVPRESKVMPGEYVLE